MNLTIKSPPKLKEKHGKTTITFRVLPKAKMALAQQAQSLESSLSEYIETLVLDRHNELIAALIKPPAPPLVELTESDKYFFDELINQLKEDYEGFNEAEILLACMVQVKENRGAFWQRSFKTFLGRIQSNFYHSKSENDDD